MFVIKRTGQREPVLFDKITERLRKLSWGLSKDIDPILIAKKVIAGIYDGIKTTELDSLSSETAASMITIHPDYGTLAARIEVSNLHKNTPKLFSNVIDKLYNNINMITNESSPMIDTKIYKLVSKYKNQLNSIIIHSRDYSYDYFGIKTLIKNYLFRINGIVVERPQHLLMRVALGIHHNDINSVINTYNLMSKKYFTHASPTLFNASTPKPQLSSCFLLTMKDDSIEGIYDTLKQCAVISKYSGGVGLSVHNIRSKGSYIRGTNGSSSGLIPMLRVFNNTARYVDQGGGRRKGSMNIFIEPWHADIFDFISIKKLNGSSSETICRDLFISLWIPDLFMKRVEDDDMWSLMCPDQCKNLYNLYGNKFNKLYIKYEKMKKYRSQIKARSLWSAILHSQMETGQPFMLYKDASNLKSNQKNLGTIRSSNLCCEIMEYSSSSEIGVCNLASISLPKFVDKYSKTFNFQKLIEITAVITKNLNKIIDINYYPLIECRNSNLKHRPIGIGVQGLADTFLLLKLPFDSNEAKELNKNIFETIYYSAIKTSNELAQKYGSYKSFAGSPASKGLLSFDLWDDVQLSSTLNYDWNKLKKNIIKYGLRNSLVTATMPTASTSQILGNNECFEPYTSNVYIRRTLAGEYVVINKHLLNDLIKLNIWNNDIKNRIIASNGSVQYITEIPENIKLLYRTVWEIKQKEIINMAADRGPFIDQSQSLNIYLNNINYGKLTSMHFYGWKKGLKTGCYYLRTQPAVDPIKFTVQHKQILNIQNIKMKLKMKMKKKIINNNINDDDTKNDNTDDIINNNNDVNDVEGDGDDDYKHDVDEYKLRNNNNNNNNSIIPNVTKKKQKVLMCSRFNRDACMSCGS